MASSSVASARSEASAAPFAFIRGIGVRQVRLICGLILFSYLLSHYINHALGNISLGALEYGLRFHMGFWTSPIGTLLLYPALFVHGSLGLWALYRRRYFRWKAAEITQLTLGLLIPLMLCTHLIGERLGVTLYGLHRSYALALYNFWVGRPDLGAMQATLILVAWIHGCIGLYFWLRLKRSFPALAPLLLGMAVLLPALALLGYYQQGRTVRMLAENPAWRAEVLAPDAIGPAADGATLVRIRDGFLLFYAGAIGFVFAARGVRFVNERRRGTIKLSYPDRMVRVPKGLSVLEASYRHRIPHANVCGGKGRCSTCRIRIAGDASGLPPPSPREEFVLERIGADADPAIRLACQLRPTQDIAVAPLLPPQIGTAFLRGGARMHPGEERYIVSMFVDMRGSTQMAADQLPFDTVFIVNRFLGAVARAVTQTGGKVNQYLGDGLLALFGVDTDARTACRQALRAAAAIAANVEDMNGELAAAARSPIRFGIGINGGDVIVGDIGYGENVAYTALGDAVNVAARLQEMTKEFACQAMVADEVCELADFTDDASPAAGVKVRGRAEPVVVRKIADAAMLAPMPPAAANATARSVLRTG
jgi:adenylate cyclase